MTDHSISTERLKKLLAEVTQGDWKVDSNGFTVRLDGLCGLDWHNCCALADVLLNDHPEKVALANAALIALAPTLARELLSLREAERWIPIEKAPRTGEHILGAVFDGGVGFGTCGGKQQAAYAVIHWWDNPGEEGWCLSLGGGDEFKPTHFQHLLPSPPSIQGDSVPDRRGR